MRIDPKMIYKKYQQATNKAEAGAKGVSGSTHKEGEVLKGQIIDASQSKVTIRLESGETMDARLTSANTYSIGDQVAFVVQATGGEQMLITPLTDGGAKAADQLMNILSGAGLPKTDENMDMLKAMIEKQLPIDQESLKQMARLVIKYPDTPVKDLVFLVKHQVPVTETNLLQLKMLENNEQPLMRSMASLVDDLSTAIATESKSVQQTPGGQVLEQHPVLAMIAEDKNALEFQKLVNQQLTVLAQVINESKSTVSPEPNQGQAMQQDLLQVTQQMSQKTSHELPQQAQPMGDMPIGQMMLRSEAENIAVMFNDLIEPQLAAGTLTEQQQQHLNTMPAIEQMTLQDLKQVATLALITHEQLRDILLEVKSANTYQTLAKGLLMSDIKVVEAGEVNDWFNKVQEKVQQIMQDTSAATKGEAVEKGASDVKASVQFLNSLQQDYNFMHLPMMLNDQLLNSELYVLNNKKATKNDRQSITALVRLDLLNLGHTDIYIKKVDKNIDVEFYMADEKQINVVQENVFVLHKLLTNKGFNVLSATVQSLESDFDVVDDFLEKGGESLERKRYSFDMRA